MATVTVPAYKGKVGDRVVVDGYECQGGETARFAKIANCESKPTITTRHYLSPTAPTRPYSRI